MENQKENDKFYTTTAFLMIDDLEKRVKYLEDIIKETINFINNKYNEITHEDKEFLLAILEKYRKKGY